MAAIDISSAGGGGSVSTGVLQLQNGVAMDSTLRSVTDQNNTASTLKLSTTSAQFTSPLRITTDDPSDFYLDCEDGSTNNRFSITRNTASQQVNLNFSSNPGGGSAIVGAIRTYVDDVNLSEIVQFREDGRIQIGSTAASAMYWDNTNNRLGVGLNTPVAGPFQVKTTQSNANGSIIFTNNTTATILAATDTGSALTQLQFRASSYNFTDTAGMRIASTGYATTPTAMLQVVGSGSTSATTALLVQNSGGSASITVKDNQSVFIGGYTSETGNNVIDQLAWKLYTQGGTQYASYIGATNNGGTGDTSLALFGLGTGGGYYGGIRMFTSSNSTTPVLAMIVDRNQSVGIGLTNSTDLTVNASAKLQVDSTTKGFLPPRMTDAQRAAISSPAEGLLVYNTDNHAVAYRDGTNWGYLCGALQNQTGSGGTLAISFASGNIVNLTLNASTTLTFAGHVVGTYIIQVTQGGAGSNTLTYPASVKWSGGTAPTLTTTVGKTDILTFYHDGTNFFGTYSLNY